MLSHLTHIKFYLEIITPIAIYLGLGTLVAENKSDWYYLLLLPFGMVLFLASFAAIIFFFKWLY